MALSARLPVGTSTNYVTINKGDVLELITGETVTFLEMKRVKFYAKWENRFINVPIFRDRLQKTPYIKTVIGKDESVIVKGVNPMKLKVGDIFSLEGHKETFMFMSYTTSKGKSNVRGKDLASRKTYNIDVNMKMIKIDLNLLKKELVNKI